ncbi:MAG: Asp-tRNA(Asn)/Glu-tRNA(Gln) amidotransferase subunit GatC [Edaphobacter sp.]
MAAPAGAPSPQLCGPARQGWVAPGLGGQEWKHGETLRPDTIKPSVDRAAVMAVAPETDGRFFKVPKVIER